MALKKAVKSAVVDSWLTSLIGVLGSAATILLPMVQSGQTIKQGDWIQAGIVLAMGLAAKQGNVMGGTVTK